MRLRRNNYTFLLFFLLSLTAFNAVAQSTEDAVSSEETIYVAEPEEEVANIPKHTTVITDKDWNHITNQRDFGYRNEKEGIAKSKAKSDNSWILKLLENVFKFFTSSVGQFILWGLLIALLAFGIFKIFIGEKSFLFTRRQRSKKIEEEQPEEEDILEINWEHKMHEAVQRNDLRHAVRYSYMLLLQTLQNKQLIDYRIDKTNAEYYRELQGANHKQVFRQLTRQYEYAWYGKYDIAQPAFDNYMNQFRSFQNELV